MCEKEGEGAGRERKEKRKTRCVRGSSRAGHACWKSQRKSTLTARRKPDEVAVQPCAPSTAYSRTSHNDTIQFLKFLKIVLTSLGDATTISQHWVAILGRKRLQNTSEHIK